MPSSFSQDAELAEFFTDVEHLRDAFRDSVAAPTLTKRLFVIHGVGGVGKSSLLRMFRLHCKNVTVPVAFASGDEAKSAPDVLVHWTDDLKADRVAFPAFAKTYEHYREIQAKVETQAKQAGGRAADVASKAASKTAEAAGGTLAGAAIGSIIPGIGTTIGAALGGTVGGMGAEALTDWLRGFLKQPDIDLLLDPTKKLTDDFLGDTTKAADKRRIVLMLDTFEQMTALEDWARDVVQRLHTNVLFVIAGRALPNWSRAWDSWQKNAHIEELKPMTEDVMRELVRRYYATMRGGEPDPTQVETIIRFARGLPMVVTSAVQLWVKYGVEDFQTVKAEIVANLADRLMEGVPNALIPALEAAASVRWFDQPILRAVMQQDDVRDAYNELRRFPFVRVRVEGLALHDSVREIMDENLRVQDSERHYTLHVRAAAYFEERLEKVTGEEAERLGPEQLYHRTRADEEAGIKLFQETAERLESYRLLNQLRVLLNDVNTYPLESKSGRLWREYYNIRLAFWEARLSHAEKLYEAIGQDEDADPKLRAYALCDLGQILARNEYLSQPGGVERALNILGQSQRFGPIIDSKLVAVFSDIRRIYTFKAEWKRGIEFLEQQLEFFQQNDNKYGVVYTLGLLRHAYGAVGNWKKASESMSRGSQLLRAMPESAFLRVRLTGYAPWNLIWSGRYIEVEQEVRNAIDFIRQVGDVYSLPYFLRDLGLVLGLQTRYAEASASFTESTKSFKYQYDNSARDKGVLLGFWGNILTKQGLFEKAEEYLIQSLSLKHEIQDNSGIPEVLGWLGELSEVRANRAAEAPIADLTLAESYDRQALDYRWTGRCHFECAALAGLVRVKQALGDYAAIPSFLTEAEQLAQQYEYNDHLASLRLTQGHIAWEGKAPTWENGFGTALHFYQHALIYALRYNRFLQDEVLSGRPQGSPLRPVIPHCLERGEEGRQMLTALRDWWKTGVNDIGTSRPDTISPIPEGISLLEAERLAREREPGDGTPQKSVVAQIEEVLSNQRAG